MKHVFVAFLLAALLAAPAFSQDEAPKPRKRLFFFPGKKPDPTPVPVAEPVEKATPKPTPKATPKPTPKATPKPTPKATPKPAPKATPEPEPEPAPAPPPPPAPPAASAEAKAKDALDEKFIEPATPTPKATPKPATPPPTPAPKPRATPAPSRASLIPVRATPAPTPEPVAAPSIVTSTVPPEPAQIIRAFFALLGKKDIDGAYEGLMKGSKIGERPQEVLTLKIKTREAIELFGTIHGYDLVELKPVGERLMRTTYLSLGQELPLRWRFYFYKAEATWKLIDLRVDDKLTGIFDEEPEDTARSSESRP